MQLKLGKLAPKIDERTLKLSTVLVELPPIPIDWNSDANCAHKIPTPMFANDRYGCCVIAGRAHQTLRFECKEQDAVIPIQDSDVIEEYLKESDGEDSGLVMLDSLRQWRKNGWKVGGRVYNIHTFASINPEDQKETMAGIYLFSGSETGIAMPISVREQFKQGAIWDVVGGPDGEKGSWGGHCVYLYGYNNIGPMGVSWGNPVQMTWEFFNIYCDECFAVIDDRDKWLGDKSPLDLDKLDAWLLRVTA